MRRTVLQTLTAAGLALAALLMANAATPAARPMMDPIPAGGGDACPVLTPPPIDAHRSAERRVGAPRAAAMFLLLMPPRARLVALSR